MKFSILTLNIINNVHLFSSIHVSKLLTRRIFIFAFITLLTLNLPLQALAQEASGSPSASISNSLNSKLQDATQSAVVTPEVGEAQFAPTPAFSSPEDQSSAKIKMPSVIHALGKRSFRASEDVNVVIDNAENQSINAKVLDGAGKETDFAVFTDNQGSRKIVIVKPPAHFAPGKYTIEISTTDGQIYKQDFTWGVLAINTNKSIYLPNETAKLAMAVLDASGEMVCDAKVVLLIKAPDQSSQTLTTDNGKIAVNSACLSHSITLTPDYEANFLIGNLIGTYEMDLSAQTKNGTYEITDSFEVKSQVPFDVERVSATRIFPPNPYPVSLNIEANQDFDGVVSEVVPGSFVINDSPDTGSAIKGVSTTSESAVSSGEITGASVSASLSLPFKGMYPIGEEFGEQLRDSTEKKVYAQYNLAGHDGVDFDMNEGTPVFAADSGKVTLAGPGAYGTTIVIEHSWGKSYYGHLSVLKTKVGDEVDKGDEIGLSGSTGLSTGPHLHFGVKLNGADVKNGYYGKSDPLPLLGLASHLDPASQLKVVSWNVTLKKGDRLTLGYFYKAPSISPEFYTLGPLRFYQDGKQIFQEARMWQIAVDADGSGTNTVTPQTGMVGTAGNNYTFTYTTGESVATGSGQITIQVPAGWTQPQTSSSSTAGYTTISSSSTATVGDVLDSADANTNWSFNGNSNNHHPCGSAAPVVDSSAGNSIENGKSLKCVNGTGTAGVSSGDTWYKAISTSDWTNYNKVGLWMKETGAASVATNTLQFAYSTSNTMATTVEAINMSAQLNTGIWTWETFSFGATTRNAIQSFGFNNASNTATDGVTIWTDYFLIGPGSPTITGSGPWTISIPIVTIPANTGTIIVNYGGGTLASSVTNSSTGGGNTFTTKSKIAENPTNILTSIASQATVTLASLDMLMRHGEWFTGGVDQPFLF